MKKTSIFDTVLASVKQTKTQELSLADYLEQAKIDKTVYSTASERMVKAIGEPDIFDTSHDSRLRSIFEGRKIKIFPTFKNFFGIEQDIASIHSFFLHASQGLEEFKQILFLLGDVGCGKSSIVEHLKYLIEQEPIYALKINNEISPVLDSPLALFLRNKDIIQEELGIADRYFPACASPWLVKRLGEVEGDITQFKVVRIFPSRDTQTAIAKIEPLDDNNADMGTLVGKIQMRKMEFFANNDADAYGYTGGLCRANRGMLEMAEMYKANIKTLNPLLEASQSRSYNGLEQVGAIPFDGLIVSHSNKSEWAKFKSDKKNEALVDRIYLIKMHYSTRYTEEELVLDKMLKASTLASSPTVKETKSILAKFAVMSRLEDAPNSNIFSKLHVYNGDNTTGDSKAFPYLDYKNNASQDEAMSGISPRWEFKLLSEVYNYDPLEVGADPITLLKLLKVKIKKEQLEKQVEEKYFEFIDQYLEPEYVEELGKQIQRSYIESYDDYAQAKFDRYYNLALAWVDNKDYADPNTGILLDINAIHKELQILESEAGVGNYRDFRNEITRYILTKKAEGIKVKWNSYAKLTDIIEKSVFKSMEDLLPVISFNAKQSKGQETSHKKFLDNMIRLGYTESQVKRAVTYYIQKQHS